jgi:hypothetical protein
MAVTSTWVRKTRLKIDHTKVTGDQSDFPVALVWNGTTGNIPTEVYNNSVYSPLSSGADIRFTSDSAGTTELAFEIVTFTPNATVSSARVEIYVKLPSVSSATDTVFYMHYNVVQVVNDHTTGTLNNQFEYVGSWTQGTWSGNYQGDETWSETTNDYVQIRFTGTQIRLYGRTDPAHGIGLCSIDAGSETEADFYGSSATQVLVYSSITLAYGTHTLKVRLGGTKNAASGGYYVVIDKVEILGNYAPTRIDDHTTGTGTNQFEFVGSWTQQVWSGDYNGDETYSNTNNDYFQVRFNGTKVMLYTRKGPDMGIAAISIDGGSETLVDFYAANYSYQAILYTSGILSFGSHTLKVRVTNTHNAASSNYYIIADKVEAELCYIATDTYGRNAVWSNGFNAVWHMKTVTSVDATGNGYTMAVEGAGSASVVEKDLGTAVSFGDNASVRSVTTSPATFTLSFLKTQPTQSNTAEFSRNVLVWYCNNNDFWWYDGSWQAIVSSGAQTEATSHECVVIDPSTSYERAFRNGTGGGANNTSGAIVYDTAVWEFGSSWTGWYGTLDEIRRSTVRRADTWVSTESNSLIGFTTFIKSYELVTGQENFLLFFGLN